VAASSAAGVIRRRVSDRGLGPQRRRKKKPLIRAAFTSHHIIPI